jgi:hypothetical protein
MFDDDFDPVDDLEMHEEDVPHEHCGACMTLIDRAVVFTYVFEGRNKRLAWCHDCAKLCSDVLDVDMYEDLGTAIIEHDELCENEDMLAFAHRRIEALKAYSYGVESAKRNKIECEIETIKSKIEEQEP